MNMLTEPLPRHNVYAKTKWSPMVTPQRYMHYDPNSTREWNGDKFNTMQWSPNQPWGGKKISKRRNGRHVRKSRRVRKSRKH
jgi:hypothetical protein